MNCNTALCEMQTQTCISLFQQQFVPARISQNAAITSVVLGGCLLKLGVNDIFELIRLGAKKLLARQIHRSPLDLAYLTVNGSLKISCGTLLILQGFHAKPYSWNSTIPNQCLILSEKIRNMNYQGCNEVCISAIQLPGKKFFDIPIICGITNLSISVLATANDVKNIFIRFKKNHEEQLALINDTYRQKKFKVRIFSNILQMILSILIVSLFCSNIFANQSNPSVRDKCTSFCNTPVLNGS